MTARAPRRAELLARQSLVRSVQDHFERRGALVGSDIHDTAWDRAGRVRWAHAEG